jgi:drug/metabolite transporter (DMT)-like permease
MTGISRWPCVCCDKIWGSGLLSIMTAALCFSVSSALVRPISRAISVFELVFVRSFLSMALTFVVRAGGGDLDGRPLFGERSNVHLLILRGTSGALAMNCFYASIQRLLLAEALALLFLNPAIVAVLAYFFLDERLTLQQILGIGSSLFGMLLVVKPPLLVDNVWTLSRGWGVLFGVASAHLAAVAYISIRKIGKKEQSLTIAVYFHATALLTSVIGLGFGLFGSRIVIPKLFPDFLCMALIAPCSFLAQLLISRGFQLERAAVGAAVNYLQVFFGALFGLIFYDEPLDILGILGIFLIFVGVLAISLDKKDDGAMTTQHDDRGGEAELLLPAQGVVPNAELSLQERNQQELSRATK